ncbi:MAG: hypothetical protein GY938_24445 [Ketobacter sp.]|nr:hypothetical protein [Ketobacter sp.]
MSTPIPPVWIHEINWHKPHVRDAVLARQQAQHVVEDDERGFLIDGVPYNFVVATMANAVAVMHNAKYTITDRSFALFGFTPNQVHYCNSDAVAMAFRKGLIKGDE